MKLSRNIFKDTPEEIAAIKSELDHFAVIRKELDRKKKGRELSAKGVAARKKAKKTRESNAKRPSMLERRLQKPEPQAQPTTEELITLKGMKIARKHILFTWENGSVIERVFWRPKDNTHWKVVYAITMDRRINELQDGMAVVTRVVPVKKLNVTYAPADEAEGEYDESDSEPDASSGDA